MKSNPDPMGINASLSGHSYLRLCVWFKVIEHSARLCKAFLTSKDYEMLSQ